MTSPGIRNSNRNAAQKKAQCIPGAYSTVLWSQTSSLNSIVLGPSIPAPDSAEKSVLLAELEVTRVASPPELLPCEQGRKDQANGAEDSENRVRPCKSVQAVEGAGDATRGGLGRDLGRVLRDFVDGLEDRGATGADGFAADGSVPVAAVLEGVSICLQFGKGAD